MKRGIALNLTFLFILLLLVALPFLVMFLAAQTAESLGCQMSGASMPAGFCGTLYSILVVVGWSSIAIVPLTVGALLLYVLGVVIFFAISQVLAWVRGQPISPIAKGMMTSTLAIILLGGSVTGGVLAFNWFRVDFVNRCEGLPGPLNVTGKENGPLALAVKVPADSEIESRTILVIAPDGELLFRLNKSFWAREPAWSPDGAQLAFTAQDWQTRRFDLRLVDAQGAVSPALLTGQTKLENTSWMPDGKSLLIEGLSGLSDTELFFINADGSGLRRLTGADGYDGDAQTSPDGTQIVFVSNRDGNEDIYLMDIDGSNVRRLTNNPANDVHPAWSPDGRWIVFASNRGSGLAMNNYNLYVMSTDGGNQCQLTQGEDSEWEPVWSPDGQWIAYVALLERKAYLVRPDGKETRPLPLPVEVEDIYSLDWAAGK
jgi:dipeptidyl aminopeptidase/acylaminoacyl peptidase